MTANPFDALGLPAGPDLTDEQVRAAWRKIAAATHPDRRGGGDVARYTEAAAAYAQLRTGWGRSEALPTLPPAAVLPPCRWPPSRFCPGSAGGASAARPWTCRPGSGMAARSG